MSAPAPAVVPPLRLQTVQRSLKDKLDLDGDLPIAQTIAGV